MQNVFNGHWVHQSRYGDCVERVNVDVASQLLHSPGELLHAIEDELPGGSEDLRDKAE